jgi:uncharacterized membrane protein (DUF373 family)
MGTTSDVPNADTRVAVVDRAYLYAETALYAVVALALLVGAVALLVDTFATFAGDVVDEPVSAATTMLGTLLLVFVFVELLAAVRATMRERRLVAEPFLLVGIIATIKEIVVTGASTPEEQSWEQLRDAMVEVGVLSGVVLVLAVAALLLRRREREPQESDS